MAPSITKTHTQAGDAGKGFAVVANEVRALAQRSVDAANDIKDQILNSTGRVKQGVRCVGETGGLLQAILERVATVNGQVQEVAEASATQASSLKEVNSSFADRDCMTQQNAPMVEESTAAARSLAGEAGDLGRLGAWFQVDANLYIQTRDRPPAIHAQWSGRLHQFNLPILPR